MKSNSRLLIITTALSFILIELSGNYGLRFLDYLMENKVLMLILIITLIVTFFTGGLLYLLKRTNSRQVGLAYSIALPVIYFAYKFTRYPDGFNDRLAFIYPMILIGTGIIVTIIRTKN